MKDKSGFFKSFRNKLINGIFRARLKRMGYVMKNLSVLILLGFLFLFNPQLQCQTDWVKTNGPFGPAVMEYEILSSGRVIFLDSQNSTYVSDKTGKNSVEVGFDTIPYNMYYYKSHFLYYKDSLMLILDGFTVFKLNETKLIWENLKLNLDSTENLSFKNFFQLNGIIYLSIYGKGLYRLSNDFKKWNAVLSYSLSNISDIKKIVQASNNHYLALNSNGIYQTDNFSGNWDTVIYRKYWSTDLELIQASNGNIYMANYNSAYAFNNQTNTFDSIITVPSSLSGYVSEFMYFNNNDIYIGGTFLLSKTSDTGRTYKVLMKDTLCSFGFKEFKITKNDFSVIFHGNLFISEDSGSTWDRLDFDCKKSSILNILPINKDTIFVENWRGLYQTYDRGNYYQYSFSPCSVLVSIKKLLIMNDIIFGNMERFFFYSTNHGKEWSIYNSFMLDFEVDSNFAIYSTWGERLTKSNDFFVTSDTINGNFPPFYTGKPVNVSSVIAKGNKELICGASQNIYNHRTSGIYMSHDDGLTWDRKIEQTREISNFIRNGDLLIGVSNYYQSDTIDRCIYLSTDFGESWTVRSLKLNQGSFEYSISPNNVLFACDVRTDIYRNLGVLKSTDLGLSWKPYPLNLDSSIVTCLAFGPDSMVWCGTDKGSVYYSYYNEKGPAVLKMAIDKNIGFIPTIADYSPYYKLVTNPFTADSGTGNTYSETLKLSLEYDDSSIDTMNIITDQPFISFKSIPGAGKQHPFNDFVNEGSVFNVTKDRLLDLELKFNPPKTMKPGYYTANIYFVSKELNDSGSIRLEVPIILFYNPYEWFDTAKKPGIELFLISAKKTTSNLIFGSGCNSTFQVDTVYGEYCSDFENRDFGGRFMVDNYKEWCPNGLLDINPSLEYPYSNSRDIKNFENDSTPLFYHVRISAKSTDYPIKLEYDDSNFPPDALFILAQDLSANPKFKLDMRSITEIQPSRHQYIFSDTAIKDFYIIYYKKQQVVITTGIPKPTKKQFCPGDSFDLPFVTYGIFDDSNEFVGELSDKNAAWVSNVKSLGSLKSKTSGIIKAKIPLDADEGDNFKIRVRSTNPVTYGAEEPIAVNVYQGQPVLVKDTVVPHSQMVRITPLSPKKSEYSVYNSLVGGKLLASGTNYFDLYVPNDMTCYVEAKSNVNECKTAVRAKLEIRIATSVTESQTVESNQIFPSPAFDYISLSSDLLNYSNIRILNVFGNTVFSGIPDKTIDVSSFSPGIYFLKAGDKVLKFVKI